MQRRRDIAIRPPAHIHEVVERAGRENVFWTSARRPGRVPEPGNGAAELANGVVGSDLSATRGTPSAQPIWQGSYYELAGDDEMAAPELVTGPHSGWFVATRTAGADTYEVVQRQDTTVSSAELEIRSGSDTALSIRRADDSGTLVTSTLAATDLTQQFAAVWTYRSGDIAIFGDDGQGRYSASSAHSGTVTYSQLNRQRYFHRYSGLYYTGDLYEMGEADTPLTDTQAHDLLDGLTQTWRIT